MLNVGTDILLCFWSDLLGRKGVRIPLKFWSSKETPLLLIGFQIWFCLVDNGLETHFWCELHAVYLRSPSWEVWHSHWLYSFAALGFKVIILKAFIFMLYIWKLLFESIWKHLKAFESFYLHAVYLRSPSWEVWHSHWLYSFAALGFKVITLKAFMRGRMNEWTTLLKGDKNNDSNITEKPVAQSIFTECLFNSIQKSFY